MIELPERARRAVLALGPVGEQWLTDLPGHLDHLRESWSLDFGDVLDGGTWSLVMHVRMRDGQPAVLKLAPPETGFEQQVQTIQAAAGRGYVKLCDHDPARNAALIEPLGPALDSSGLTAEQMLDILAPTLAQAWLLPRPADAEVLDKGAQLVELISTLWQELGEPCSRALAETALSYADSRARAFKPRLTVMCHGDAHPANTLAVLTPRAGAESGYVLVDPEGFVCEPAYDLGVLVRDWPGEVIAAADPVTLVRSWCRRLAAHSGIDAQAIWEWGFAERVSSGLYLIRHDHADEGHHFLASAERLLS